MKTYPAILLCLLSVPCFAQVLSNNGAVVTIPANMFISKISLENTSGTITNMGTFRLHNITVQAGSTLANSNLLQVSGALSGTGSIISTAGTVELNGSSAQSLPANIFTTNTVMNLTANNNSGITLNGALGITQVMKAETGTFNANGLLTLLSDSTGTALIDGTGAGSITGDVTMQRYLRTGFGYRYISSPFLAATVSQLATDLDLTDSFATLYTYDENVAHAGWISYTNTAGILNPWSGYAGNFGAVSSPKTIDIGGVVNNGVIGTTLYNHNNTYTLGFNLVGNPYPSPIDWDAASGWTKTNIDNALYYFSNGTNNRYQGAYRSYINGVSSDNVASNIIQSMQGFFVHVTNGAYPVMATLSCDNEVRVKNFSATYHRQSGAARPLIRISAGFTSDTVFSDPTVVYFDNSATRGFEHEMDARKMLNTDARVPSFYSVTGPEKLSISAIPEPDSVTRSIPLGLKLDKDGEIVFKMHDIAHFPPGLHPYFADVKNGVLQDMEQIHDYRLELSKGVYEGRFFLLFSKQDKVSMPGSEELVAYTKGSSVFVIATTDKSEFTITNTVGQVIRHEEIIGEGLHEIQLNATPGIYILTMIAENSKRSKKLYIGN